MKLPIDPETVKGFLDPAEGARLYALAARSAELGPCLEVGSYCGKSTIYLAAAVAAAGEQVFAIDHRTFENLTDSAGDSLPFVKAYQVYNSFIDFFALCRIFADPTIEGKGIQDLTKIGQKIIHATAYSKAPTHLGKNILEGSYFQNGKITLEFMGLSRVNNRQCALIGVDSGESSFKMILNPAPNTEIIAAGNSHYKGTIYKDLSTYWVQKVIFYETVISEVTIPAPPNRVNTIVKRRTSISNVSEEEYHTRFNQ